MKILMVFTSHDQLGNTGRKTGFWQEEGAAPYFVFRDAGVELTPASPKGGQPTINPKSDLPEQTYAMARFKKDEAALKAFTHTQRLVDVKAEDFDTVFYPGGHGPMPDLAESPESIALLESFHNVGKPIALVCHSLYLLRHVKYQGERLVKGKHVTGFTNGEEEEVQPTLCHSSLKMNCSGSAPSLRKRRTGSLFRSRMPVLLSDRILYRRPRQPKLF